MHVDHKVHHPVAVAPFVVVPGDHLHEGRVEHDTRLGVENRRARVVYVVLADSVLRKSDTPTRRCFKEK